MAVTINEEECIACGACESACPEEIIEIDDVAKLTDESACTECGSCVEACTSDAIELP